MRFELLAAIFVSPCIVERDPALPELRRIARNELCDPVKPLHSLRDAALLEIGYGAIQDLPRLFVQALPERGESEEDRAGEERSSHHSIPFGGSPILSGSRAGVNVER